MATRGSFGGGGKTPVYLRVYDISQGAAKIWSPIVLGRKVEGVWHSGVEVFGFEYFYGGGIVKMKPENVESTFGISPTRIHNLGYTSLTRSQFEKYLIAIMPMFTREVYDLVNWNCNHFTNQATKHLINRTIPSYILDLPNEMVQGGSPPIGIDDPSHPSQVLSSNENGGGGGGETLVRRNSCPSTPTNYKSESETEQQKQSSSQQRNHRKTFLTSQYCESPSSNTVLLSPRDAYNLLKKPYVTRGRDDPSRLQVNGILRSSQRRKTHTAITTSSAAAVAAVSSPSTCASSPRDISPYALPDYQNCKRINGAPSSPQQEPAVVSFKHSPSHRQNNHHHHGKVKLSSDLVEDTRMVISPLHKRRYEIERDMYAIGYGARALSRSRKMITTNRPSAALRRSCAVNATVRMRPTSLGPNCRA